MNGPRGPVDGSSNEPFRTRLDHRDPGQPAFLATPQLALSHFDPARANITGIARGVVNEYLDEHAATRPWLASALDASREVQLIFLTLDLGNGHLLQRHGPWATSTMIRERVSELRDPAITDPSRRLPGADAYKRRQHQCDAAATRFTDPYALATCFARAVEYVSVRRALDRAFDPDRTPGATRIPISQLLGPDGHRYIDGYRLNPSDGDVRQAKRRRSAWAYAAARNPQAAGPPEPAVPITNLTGLHVLIHFMPDFAGGRYTIATMYPVGR